MKVRLANKFDLPYFIDTVKLVHGKDFAKQFHDVTLDDTHLNVMFNSVIHGAGVALIIESSENIGLSFGCISPNVWHPQTLFLHNLIFYIEEEWRNTTAGHRLLTAYNNAAKELQKQGRIHSYTISAAEPLFEVDFERFGYNMVEKTWMGV